jgi:cytochrome bd ubiquinol oxidase subunit I
MDFTDPVFLARLQFAFTIGMHIIFPAFTIGLASYLAVLNGAHLITKSETWLNLFDYWKKIFAVNFGMGVVSGIVMSYEFGTNWSTFADKAGPVIGPLMGYEVLTAFFLEAGFLGVMLFGRDKVGPVLHFIATLMVAIGTFISAFWILAVNSWMQTPAGFARNDAGQFVVTDWWQVIFNPSFPYRLTHMVLAAYLTTAFVVGAAAAWHLLKDNQNKAARTMFSMAMWMAALVAPLQIAAGDTQGLNTLEHQPRKIAAIEGHYETERGASLVLFGIPNAKDERMDYKIEIPKLGSLILAHDLNGEIKGLKAWPADQRPPVGPVFYAFRIMVGIGFAMLGLGLWSLWLRLKGKLYDVPWMHRAAILMGPSGFIALLAGWTVTEVGRQPYTVYGLLTTAESASAIDASAVGASFIAFIIVYFAVFGAGVFYMFREMAKIPGRSGHDLPPDEPIRASGIMPAPALAAEHAGGQLGH